MLGSSSEIYIEGERIDFTSGQLTKEGVNTASKLTFTIPGDDITYRKYWGKEVTFFLDKSDACPMFRGFIDNADINENYNISFRAIDVLGYLTGLNRAKVVCNDKTNVDGLSVGPALKKMIEIANLTKVGTDYLSDTNPIKKMGKIRGDVYILDSIVSKLGTLYNTDNVILPRQNILKVIDDGKKGQLSFDLLKDVNTAPSNYEFTEGNMINFEVRNRKIPTIINVAGNNSAATFKHEGGSIAYGENTLNINNPNLKSKAECLDFAQVVYNANLDAKYEYSLSTYEGAYLDENDIVNIRDGTTDIEGNFRIIGKTIGFGANTYSVELTINKQPPLLASFLNV